MSYSSGAETFNARHKSALEVAEDFIPPPEFEDLLALNNCILVGPRGSGKTTLLKMLEASALLKWFSKTQSDPVAHVGFVGVFVAADVRWAKQLELVTESVIDEETRTAIHELAFSNFVCLSLIDAFQAAVRLGIILPKGKSLEQLNKADDFALACKLSRIWAVGRVPSLEALKHELRIQQARIPVIAQRVARGDWKASENEFQNFGTSWLNSFVLAVETINESIGLVDLKWALLVDELEIIPQRLLERILAPLRSTSPHVLFKFALSPTGAGSHILASYEQASPSEDNDFAPLKLWGAQKDETRLFASRLLLHALQKKRLVSSGESLESVLGLSGMAAENDGCDGVGEAGRVSLEQRKKMFYDLSLKDASFASFLKDKNIEIAELPTADSTAGGTLVRKITPLVYLRNHVLKSWSHDKVSYRSKVSLQPYFRFPNILDLTEGNPRWILNLAETLTRESRAKELPIHSQSVQMEAIRSFKDRFVSMLAVYPVGPFHSDSRFTPFSFLELLANHIREKMYVNEFSSDPALAFKIDRHSAVKYGDLISICIHLGALVLVDEGNSRESAFIPGAESLAGRVVRLCHRLSPNFFLPLRAGRPVNMSSALPGLAAKKTIRPKLAMPEKAEKTEKAEKKALSKSDQINLF